MKRIRLRTAEKKWRHGFSHSVVPDQIWSNFNLIQALMYVIITCKYEKDPIKKSREKVESSFFPLLVYGDFFRPSREANSAVGGLIRPKFELVRALMHVTVACKYEKDWVKNSREKVETPFSPL